MSIFYTIGNTNLETVKLVAKSISEEVESNKYSKVNKIVIFNSPESHKVLGEQISIYREYLGENVRTEDVALNSDGISDPEEFSQVFKEQGEKIIDLTNGQKTSAALLYMCASLLGIDTIYYLSTLKKITPQGQDNFQSGIDYNYIKLPRINNISTLARISYFDLIYYVEEIDKILDINDSPFILEISRDLKNSINTFFDGKPSRSAVSDATVFVEGITAKLLGFLQEYQPARVFSQNNRIIFEQRDPLGAIDFFFKKYSRETGDDENLVPLITLPGLLSALRSFRNISAHSSNTNYGLKAEDVRIVLNMAIEALRKMKESKELWEYIRR